MIVIELDNSYQLFYDFSDNKRIKDKKDFDTFIFQDKNVKLQ